MYARTHAHTRTHVRFALQFRISRPNYVMQIECRCQFLFLLYAHSSRATMTTIATLFKRPISNSSSPAEIQSERRTSNSSSLAERRISNSSSPAERRTSHSSSLAERRTSNSSSLAKRRASNSSPLAERRTSNSSSPVIERRTSNSSSPADRRISHCHGYILPKDTRLSWIGLIGTSA